MTSLPKTVVALLLASSWAVAASPVGLWRSLDEKTGKIKALIRIEALTDGTLRGRIERIFPEPNEVANPLCTACDGALKGKPILGMTIMSQLRQEDDEWTGGWILDPQSGTNYKCKISLDGNEHLVVRGYLGFAALGRSQKWVRHK